MNDIFQSEARREAVRVYRQKPNGQDIAPMSDRARKLLDALQEIEKISPRINSRYLVKGWLDDGTFSVVYGESNVGKTFFALDLALHVASGIDWHGQRVSRGAVLYVAAEGGGGIGNRLEAVRKENPGLVDEADFHMLPVSLDLCGASDARAIVEVASCLGLGVPALIVVDTLSRVMGAGDENAAKDVGQLVRNVDFLRARLGCHVMLVHHSGKDTSKGARGSSALRAAVDTEIELTREGDVISAETRKQRDMTAGRVFAYQLKDVEIGTDEDGDAVTSAVVVETEAPTKKPRLTGSQEVALNALDDALVEHGKRMQDTTNFPARKVVSEAEWRAMCDRHGLTSTDSTEARRKAFTRARDALMEKHVIRAFDGFIWKVQPNEI